MLICCLPSRSLNVLREEKESPVCLLTTQNIRSYWGALPTVRLPLHVHVLPRLQLDPNPSDPGRWGPELLGVLWAGGVLATLAHLTMLVVGLLPQHSHLLHARGEGLPAGAASTSHDGPVLNLRVVIVCKEAKKFQRDGPSRDCLDP